MAAAAESTEGPLIVYYVGHGLVSPSGALHLATSGTDPRPNRVEHTALSYDTVRRYLLDSPARPLVVILDCCFSGHAVSALNDHDGDISSLSAIEGGVVLTSAGREELAFAPEGERHTVFTGALLRLLEQGDPTEPSVLTVRAVCRHLTRVLPSAGYPRPQWRVTGEAGDFVLAANPAWQRPAIRTAAISPQIRLEGHGALGDTPHRIAQTGDVAASVRRDGRPARSASKRMRRSMVLAAAACVLIVSLGLGLIALNSRGDAGQRSPDKTDPTTVNQKQPDPGDSAQPQKSRDKPRTPPEATARIKAPDPEPSTAKNGPWPPPETESSPPCNPDDNPFCKSD